MSGSPTAKGPIVLSYLTLRSAVGGIALGLPFILAIPWWIFRNHVIESSISGYYYTGMRNFFEGCLCAISMFMLCCRGYDCKDEILGRISAVFALGVAFFPTRPNGCATPTQRVIGDVHYASAAGLFLTLALFCLWLFRKTANKATMTRGKRYRNKVYMACGIAIIASMLAIIVLTLANVKHLVGDLSPMFCFETTALLAFGIAWLVKGETFLKDENPQPAATEP
jgi:hypothetical protein